MFKIQPDWRRNEGAAIGGFLEVKPNQPGGKQGQVGGHMAQPGGAKAHPPANQAKKQPDDKKNPKGDKGLPGRKPALHHHPVIKGKQTGAEQSGCDGWNAVGGQQLKTEPPKEKFLQKSAGQSDQQTGCQKQSDGKGAVLGQGLVDRG